MQRQHQQQRVQYQPINNLSSSFFCKNADSIRNNVIVGLALSCVMTVLSIIFIIMTKRYKYPYFFSLVGILGLSIAIVVLNTVNIFSNIATLPQDEIKTTKYTCGQNDDANYINVMTISIVATQSLTMLLALILFFVKNEVAIRVMYVVIGLIALLAVSLYAAMLGYIKKR